MTVGEYLKIEIANAVNNRRDQPTQEDEQFFHGIEVALRGVAGNLDSGEITSGVKIPRVVAPVDDGWYWYRKDDQHQWCVFEVWNHRGCRWCSPSRQMIPAEHNFVINFNGEWYGPLTPPTQ